MTPHWSWPANAGFSCPPRRILPSRSVANPYAWAHPGSTPAVPYWLATRPIAITFNINGARLDIDRVRIIGTRCRSCPKDRTGRESAQYAGRDLAIFRACAVGERGQRDAKTIRSVTKTQAVCI